MRISRVRCWIVLTLVLVGGAVAPRGVAAQTISSPYRFIEGRHDAGIYFGYLADNRGTLGIGPGAGPIVGARYALELQGPFAVEGNGYLISSERDIYQPITGEGLVPVGSADMTLAGIDARIRFTLTGTRTWYGFAPYLAAGGGLVGRLGREAAELESGLQPGSRFRFGPSFVGVLATGTRWIPNDRFTIRLEAGLNLWKVGMPPGFNEVEPEEGPLPGDDWTGVTTLVLGASYRF